MNTSALVVAPNHEQKGSKKIFFKNFMDARVNYVILPVAKRLLRADQAALASAEGYLATTMMHEISHGLGPAFARTRFGQPPTHLLGQRLGLQHHTRLRA